MPKHHILAYFDAPTLQFSNFASNDDFFLHGIDQPHSTLSTVSFLITLEYVKFLFIQIHLTF